MSTKAEKTDNKQSGLVAIIVVVIVGIIITILVLLLVAAITGGLRGVNSINGGDNTQAGGETMDCGGVAKVPVKYMAFIKEAANRWLGGDQAFLIATISTETGGKWNADAKNSSSSSTGLGQFINSTAAGQPEFVGGCDTGHSGKCSGRVWPTPPGQTKSTPLGSPDARLDPERAIFAVAHKLHTIETKKTLLGKSKAEMYRIGYHTGNDADAMKAEEAFQKNLDATNKGCTETNLATANPSGKGCNNVPSYLQCHQSYSDTKIFVDETICTAGCSMVSAAMVAKFYGAKPDNPSDMAVFSKAAGETKQGLSGEFWGKLSQQNHLHFASASGKGTSWQLAKKYLQQGVPVIAHGAGAPPFSENGHYVVLTCYNATQHTVGVNDPMGGKKKPAVGEYKETAISGVMDRARVFYK